MKKIIKLEDDEVIIATAENGNIRTLYEWLNLKPKIDNIVEVFEDGEELIVYKAESYNKLNDKLNIDIINENTQQQSNNVSVQGVKPSTNGFAF